MELTYEPIRRVRILAVDPFPRGFGFVVLEDEPLQLVDWAVKTFRDHKGNDALEKLIDKYQPTVVVSEDPSTARLLRRNALHTFIYGIDEVLAIKKMAFHLYSRDTIKSVFSPDGIITKRAIAEQLVLIFPELASRLPKARQIWESEDLRMSIFDALSMALTHLKLQQYVE